jgi:pilus assembly protein CpaE
MMEQNFDVYIIDLDGDQRYALELVEEISANPAVTVMVFSMNNDPNLLMSCMRSGAREFLSQPVALGPLNEALSRASSRRPTTRMSLQQAGRKGIGFSGRQGRLRRYHSSLQLCRLTGAGVRAERGTDRS